MIKTITHTIDGAVISITEPECKADQEELEAREILINKLREMSKVTFDDCDGAEGYALICSAMCDIYNAITAEK